MLKKALAITLALVMLLMPMTASAVTWNQLVTGLRNSGGTSYTSDDGETTITREVEDVNDGQKATLIYVRGGKIEFDEIIVPYAYDEATFYNQFFFQGITADELHMSGADGQAIAVVLQEGSQVGALYGDVGADQIGDLANTDGSVVDIIEMYVHDGGFGAAGNHEATVNVGIIANASDGGEVLAHNTDGYAAEMHVNADSGSKATGNNYGTVGVMDADAYADGTVELRNDGYVQDVGVHATENGTVSLTNNGEAAYIGAGSSNGGTTSFQNNGTVDHVDPYSENGGYTTMDNTGTINMVYGSTTDGELHLRNDGTVTGEMHASTPDGSGLATAINGENGTVGTLYGCSDGGGKIELRNDGTAGDVGADAWNGGEALVQNYGTTDLLWGDSETGGTVTAQNMENATAGTVSALGTDGGSVNVVNDGTVEERLIAAAWGEGGVANSVNNGTVGGQIRTTAGDGATGTSINTGTANGLRIQSSNGSEVQLENAEGATLGDVQLVAFDGQIDAINNGAIEYAIVDPYGGSKVSFDGKGTVDDAMVYINVPSTDTYTASQIQEILKAINIPNAGTELYTMDENGEFTARYEITEDGQLVLIEVFEEKEHEIPVEPDPVEEQRQLEGIGGVTTSPVWNWQGYLGHSSKPMWIYVNGEKTLMRQRLFWLGDSTKNHTCRINVAEPDPASVELRVGLDMLRTAKRAEISVISILDSENNPVAQFAVSDLLAAFEQYGLVEGELLCVSADADAEVMKVTLDGEYLPLEEKAE